MVFIAVLCGAAWTGFRLKHGNQCSISLESSKLARLQQHWLYSERVGATFAIVRCSDSIGGATYTLKAPLFLPTNWIRGGAGHP